MMNQPLVSVLMTVYNREKYIAEAIESVLASSYTNWELIIVDDCSKDSSLQIALRYEAIDSRIHVYQNPKNLGDYPNRMHAASLAKGKYLKYLDSDDVIYIHGLQVMVEAMESNTEAGMALTFNNYENEQRLPISFTSEAAFEYHFNYAGLLYIGPTGCIYNREYFFELGGFANFGVASDYELNLRISLKRPIVLLPRDLAWWRQHPGQEINIREKEYLELNYKIHKMIIGHKDCPLKPDRRKRVIVNINKNYARKVYICLLTLKFKKAFFILKFSDLPLKSFLHALLPAQIRHKL